MMPKRSKSATSPAATAEASDLRSRTGRLPQEYASLPASTSSFEDLQLNLTCAEQEQEG